MKLISITLMMSYIGIVFGATEVSSNLFKPYYDILQPEDLASLGQSTGNGGDVVVCDETGGNKSYEILDFYEAKYLHGLSLDMPISGDEYERARYHLKKLSRWEYYNDYKMRIEQFPERIELVNDELIDIPDSYHTYIPSNCKLEQIAINQLNGKIEINQRLWNLLDTDQKSILILHELFYEDMILSGHISSVFAREINSFLIGDAINKKYYYDLGGIFFGIYRNAQLLEKDPFLFYKVTPIFSLKLKQLRLTVKRLGSDPYVQQQLIVDIEKYLKLGDKSKKEDFFSNLLSSLVDLDQLEIEKLGLIQKYLTNKIKNMIFDKEDIKDISLFQDLLYRFVQKDISYYEEIRDITIDAIEVCINQKITTDCQKLKINFVQLLRLVQSSDELIFDFIADNYDEFKFYESTILSFLETQSQTIRFSKKLLDKFSLELSKAKLLPIPQKNVFLILKNQNYNVGLLKTYIEKVLTSSAVSFNDKNEIYWILINLDDAQIYFYLESTIVEQIKSATKISLAQIELMQNYYRNRAIPREIVDSIFNNLKLGNYSHPDFVLSPEGVSFLELSLREENYTPSVGIFLAYTIRYKQNRSKEYAARYLAQVPFLDNFIFSVLYQEMRLQYHNSDMLELLLKVLLGHKFNNIEIQDYLAFLKGHPDNDISSLASTILNQ